MEQLPDKTHNQSSKILVMCLVLLPKLYRCIVTLVLPCMHPLQSNQLHLQAAVIGCFVMGACMVANMWMLIPFSIYFTYHYRTENCNEMHGFLASSVHAVTDCCCQGCSECLQMQFNIEDCQLKKTSCYMYKENKKHPAI